MRHAALEYDVDSIVLMATDLFREQKWAEAWAWANIAQGRKGVVAQTKLLAGRIIQAVEEQSGKDAIVAQGLAWVLKYLEEINERLEWRTQIQKGKAEAEK